MDNKDKSYFVKLILAIVVFVIFLIVFGLMAQLVKNKRDINPQPQNSVSLEPTATPVVKDETADWKTYRNEEYGFEIKYPQSPEWVVEKAKIENPKAIEPIKSIINIFPKNKVYLVEESRIDPIIIMISSGSLEDYYKVYSKSKDAVEEKVLINNLSFVRQEDEKWRDISFTVEYPKKNFSFIITSHINGLALDVSEKKLLEDIFNQILSTFKFIGKEETTNWQIYRNEKYEVKYPNDWKVKENGFNAYLYPVINEIELGIDPDIFISVNKEPYTLGFHGTWGEIPYSAASEAQTQLIFSEDVIINNISFKKDYWSLGVVVFYTKYKDKYYSISRGILTEGNGIADKDKNNEVLKMRNSGKTIFFNQILSTFKFTGKDEIADWKTYLDDYYGFELKYPSDWQYRDNRLNYLGSATFYNSIAKEMPVFIIRTPVLESGLESSQLMETNKLIISDNNAYLDIKTYKDTETDNYFMLAIYDNKISIELSMSSSEDEYENNKKLFNQILSTLKFIEKSVISDWNIYNNPEADFIFQYPIDWEISQDYFYEWLSGEISKKRTIVLRRLGQEDSNDWISINMRQFQCDWGKCSQVYGNEIGTYSNKPEILAVFDKIVGSFERKGETADWSTYTNKKYNYSFKHPQGSSVASNQYATNESEAFNISVALIGSKTRFTVEAQDPEMYLNGSSFAINKTMKLPLKEFVQEIWRQNKEDKNPNIQNKEVGQISQTTVDGKTAYQFTLTGSYHDERGGYVLDKKYLYFFVENNSLNFMIWFPDDDSTSKSILKSFIFINQ